MKRLAFASALALFLVSTANAAVDQGLTKDFSDWLTANGYGGFKFERDDLEGGAYGGKSSPTETLKHDPVIFYHGNSDIAVGNDYWQTGFTQSIEYFIS